MREPRFWMRAACLVMAGLMLASVVGGLIWQLLVF